MKNWRQQDLALSGRNREMRLSISFAICRIYLVREKLPWPAVADNMEIYDPVANRKGIARSRVSGQKTDLLLQLEPGQSCFLRCTNKTGRLPEWNYHKTDDKEILILNDLWTISPVSGAPAIPEQVTNKELVSWTEFGGDYNYFSGKARYTREFRVA